MAQITIASTTIARWHFSTTAGTGVVQLRLYANQSFIESGGTSIQGGSPDGGAIYQTLQCDLAGPDSSGDYTLTIPQFTIDSTTDAQDPPGQSSRYSGWFYVGKKRLGPFGGFESFRVLPVYSTNPASWAQIRADNVSSTPLFGDSRSYTDEQINRLIAQAVASSSGVTSVGGLTGPTITLTGGTNIQITPSGTNITFDLTGAVAIANGGTGATTAAGARTALSAAKSGANSDITSLTALSTPLSAAQGGSGLASYTAGDLLYASGATAISKLPIGAAGAVLTADGTAVPVWSTSPLISGNIAVTGTATVGSLTAGRVTFAGTSGLLKDSSTFLWDDSTKRLSLGTTQTVEAVQIANAAYYGGVNIAGSGVNKIIATKGLARVTGMTGAGTTAVYSTTPTDGIDTSPSLLFQHQYTDGGATAINPLTPIYQIGTNGARIIHGIGVSFNDSSSSNAFAFQAQVRNIGSAPTVAGFFNALASGPTSQVWGINPVAYVDCADVGATSQALAIEAGYGIQDNVVSAGVTSGGLLLTANGSAATNFAIQVQSNATIAAPMYGLVFATNGFQPVQSGGTLITTDVTGGTVSAACGVDFAAGNFTAGAFNMPYGATNGLASNNNANSGRYFIATSITDATLGTNTLQIGDITGWAGIRWMAGVATEAMRLQANKRFALNSDAVVLTHGLQMRTTTNRALTGTVATNSGSAAVDGTGTAFTSELRPGNTMRINSANYRVLDIADDTHLTLATNAASTLSGVSSTSDDPMLLIESADGNDFLEVGALGNLIVYDNAAHESGAASALTDNDGAIQVRDRLNTNRRLLFGFDDTNIQAFISSKSSSLGWENLVINAGAQSSTSGFVGIGTATPTARLTVTSGGPQSVDSLAAKINNTGTSTTNLTKIGCDLDGSGTWLGSNIGLRPVMSGALDTGNNRSNYPIQAYGGMNLFAPPIAVSPAFAPTAAVHVIGYPTITITGTTTDLITATVTSGSPTVTGSGTAWLSTVLPGGVVQFGADTATYTVQSVDSNTQLTLSTNYAGSNATVESAWTDPPLLLLANGANATKLQVDSNGRIFTTGASMQGARTKNLTESSATGFVTISVASGSYVGGFIEYSVVADDSTDFQCRSGILPFAIVNKGGTETATLGTPTTATEVVAVSTGTLAATSGTGFTADTTPTNGVTVQANFVSSLTQTTLAIRFFVHVTVGTAISITPL